MALRCNVYIDWSDDGSFATSGDNITPYVKGVSWSSGMSHITERIAPAGQCRIVVDNSDKRFSPANSGSPYYGNMLPRKMVRVTTPEGYPIFTGYIKSVMPESSTKLSRLESTIVAQDALGVLQDVQVSIPLFTNIMPGELVKLITSEAMGGAATVYAVNVLVIPSDGDTLTVGDRVYTFKTTLGSSANQIKIAASQNDQAKYIEQAINADASTIGTAYTSSTARHDKVTAEASANDVFLTAVARGEWGDSITISDTSAGLSTFLHTNGSDAPDGYLDIDAGTRVFDVAGDSWRSGEATAYRALSDVVLSDWGALYVLGDGTLRYRSSDFGQLWVGNISPSQSVGPDNEDLYVNRTSGTETTWTQITAQMSIDDVINACTVEYTPRSYRSYGVIASSNSSIEVPSGSGTPRWSPADDESRLFSVTLPFQDQGTGNMSGAEEITTPQASTDYTVNDRPDGGGFDYTSSGRVHVSVAVRGSEVSVSFTNTATGNLYVRGLQVRGVAIINSDPLQTYYTNTSSITSYGRRSDDYRLPLLNSRSFAQSLAEWIVNQFATPRFRVSQVNYQNTFTAVADGLPITEIGKSIGKRIRLTDVQTGLSSRNAIILGVTGSISANSTQSVTYNLHDTYGQSYWQLGTVNFGELGTNTYLAL